MFFILTKLPVRNPRNPRVNRKIFLHNLHLNFPIWGQKVTVSIMGGAISARVEELTAPTNEMNRSNLGIAAANETANNN